MQIPMQIPMQIHGAIIQEKGVSFAVVVVNPDVLAKRGEAQRTVDGLKPFFSGLPIVLMAQISTGKPLYYGRPDLAKFLASVPMKSIPWTRYEVKAA